MSRPEFEPVFEQQESEIRERIVERIPDAWRKEPGDFIHDAVAATPLEVKQLQINQDFILKNSFALYAEGEHLDQKLAEVGLTRMEANPTERRLVIEADNGVVIPAGHTLSSIILDGEGNPIEYTTKEAVTFTASGGMPVYVVAKVAGQQGNIPKGSEFVLVPSIPGVRTIRDEGVTINGADRESDQSAWERYDFKVKNPDTGGNRFDYIRWAGEVTGVGRVKVIPRWNGNGTVKVIIINTEYQPASPELVDEVQEYLDPNSQGLGDGKAPCGASVTVKAADPLLINVQADLIYYDGVEHEAVKEEVRKAIREYLKELAFTNAPIPVARIGSLLINVYGVGNYSNLTVNGGTADIPVGPEEVAILGTVTI